MARFTTPEVDLRAMVGKEAVFELPKFCDGFAVLYGFKSPVLEERALGDNSKEEVAVGNVVRTLSMPLYPLKLSREGGDPTEELQSSSSLKN